MNTCLSLFVKNPVPGEVKTRLTLRLSPEKAAKLYEAFLIDLVNSLSSTRCDEKVICFSPPDAEVALSSLLKGSFLYRPQRGDELGERMNENFNWTFARGADRSIIVGSDSPTLPPSYVEEAFEVLQSHSAVLGPSFDGGYYLIGLSQPCPELFQNIDWSTDHVLRQTLARMELRGIRFYLLPPWYDVDTPDQFNFLRAHLRAMELSGRGTLPSETMKFLANLDEI